MFKILKRSRSLAGLVVTSLTAIGYVVYLSQQSGPLPTVTAKPKPVPAGLETVLSGVCTEIIDKLPEPQRVLRPTLLLPLVGDREGLLTEKLRTAMNEHGWYRPVEKSAMGHLLDTAKETTGIGLKDPAEVMTLAPTELTALMKSAKAETLVRGSLDRLTLPKDAPVELKAIIELWEITPDTPAEAVKLFSGKFERPRAIAELPETVTSVAASNKGHDGYKVYAIAVLLCLFWPWLTIPRMRSAIREDSNAATLQALLGIVAVPLVAFAVFLWYRGHSDLDIVLQILLLGLILFFYVSLIMSKVQTAVR